MVEKKRILVVSQHFWPESFRINDIADFFVEKNYKVNVLCGIPNYPTGKLFKGYSHLRNRSQKHKGVNIRRVFEIPRGNNSSLRIFLNYISFPTASIFHIPRLLTQKYDKIFLYQTSPVLMTLAGIILGRIKKIETTMYVLDLWPENLFSVIDVRNPLLRKLITKVSHWHYRHVDKLIVLSEKMKTQLSEVTNLPSNKIIVLPQACEKIYETKMHDKELAHRFKTGFNIVYTGNISPAQSFETVIKAAYKLKQDGVKDINWIIVGDGMSRHWLQEEVKKTGLESSFYFEGFKPIEDIPKYTNIADLLIGCLVKSDLLEATIPAKVMSYLASGRPMVLAMDGEIQTLVNDTMRCGFAGPAGDHETFYDNIKKMYQSTSKQRINMGKRAHNYHLKHFERNIILTKMHDFIFNISSKV